ncbi:MAG: cysteine--tRNA ligase, partial [Mucispirillum sp.]|nr:cysteine--tRNA ligase [Mucispirillum sp.]
EDKLKEASSALHRIYIFLDEVSHLTGSKKGKNMEQEICDMKGHFIKEFEEAMNDDFNTPKAVAAIFEIVRMGNTIIAGKPDTDSAEYLKEVSSYIFDIVSKVLGIINHSADEWYKSNLKIPVSEVETLIAKRAEARKNKDFALADSVRAELAEKGVEIIDTLDGTRFRTLV